MNLRFPILVVILALLPGCSGKDKEKDGEKEVESGRNWVQSGLPAGSIESQPLERSIPAAVVGEALFEKLDAGVTGIDFVHLWAPDSPHEELLQKTGFTGGGVALGDYDGDGLCDIYFTRPHGGGRLYRNLGGFKFADVTVSAGLRGHESWCTGASFADLNNDGMLDLYVCAYASENQLYLNRGDGTFVERAKACGLSFIGANVKMAFADYDLDGDLDAYLVTNRREPIGNPKVEYEGGPGTYTVKEPYRELVSVINLPGGEQKFTKAGQFDHLFKNLLVETGRLDFVDVSKNAGIEGPDHGLDVTWWDYDADGYPDLYVSNDFTDPDKFYRNRGDGTFENILATALPHTPWFTMGSATGDLNNDGRLDLVAADMSATTHYREKISMGAMEAVAWFLDTAEPRQYMRNAVYLNTGTERFMEVAHLTGLASSNWTWSMKIADLDEDGFEDAFATNGFPFDYLNSDFAAQLAKSGRASDPSAWRKAPRLPERNLAFRNDGDYGFHKQGPAWGIDELAISFGAGLGDLDGDGDLDLVVNNFSSAPSLYRNRSARHHRIRIRLQGTRSNRSGFGALVRVTTGSSQHVRFFNGGGGFMSSDEPGICSIGLGSQDRIISLSVHWPSGMIQEFGNLAADRLYTIAEPTAEAPAEPPAPIPPLFEKSEMLAAARHVERPFDDFALQPLLPNKLSQFGPAMAWGDIDGDGDKDLFLGGAAGQVGQIFLCAEPGKFVKLEGKTWFAPDRECEDMGCAFFDADGDGDLDLYVASGGVEAPVGDASYLDRLYLNQGTGGSPRFVKAGGAVPDLRESSGPVAVVDFDRDGDLDLFVGGRLVPGAYPSSPMSRLLKNEGGNFTVTGGPLAIGMVTDALWADVNGDRWPDLLVTTEYGPVRSFLNQEGELIEHTTDSGLAQLLGWWNGIAGADIDGDGDLDFAVTNFGQNTKYHPSVENPQVIYHGDLAASGRKNLVEAKPGEEGGLRPVRGKSCSTQAMPHLREKFPTFHQYASAKLEEIYDEAILANCLRLEVNTLESGILINDGMGTFAFRPLPRLAQASPGFGVAFLDADADVHPDLIIAQNFFGPQRETGRMDGGLSLLLKGDGTGGFLPILPAQSGIIIPGDATAVEIINLNGDSRHDVVIATNSGAVQVFLQGSN